MTEELRNFQPKLRQSSFLGERKVEGWQYEGDLGQLAWHLRIWPNSEDPINGYWIEGGDFFEVRRLGGPLDTDRITIQFKTGPKIVEMNAAKRGAILDLIAAWEKPAEIKAQ